MYIEQTNSTNTLIKEQYTDREHLFFVRTGYQTAGRGQSGNGWEAEKDKNILISVLLKDIRTEPSRQFAISLSVALAVRDMLAEQIAAAGLDTSRLTIKWPNDIYYDDKKICGILIETALAGNKIEYAIAGIGVNINQTEWVGKAPNPTSLRLITEQEYNIERLSDRLIERIGIRTEKTGEAQQKAEYMNCLYRREGWHWYKKREVSLTPTMPAKQSEIGRYIADGTAFEGKIEDITEQGEIRIKHRDGDTRIYHFKEIQYII